GEEDGAHAAAAELANQPVRADPGKLRVGGARLVKGGQRAVDLLLDEAAGCVVARQQRRHFPPPAGVAGALIVEQRRRPAGGQRERLFEQIADRLPAGGVHAGGGDSSRCSHASARRCSRPIVPTETFNARAVSSTLKPAKYRSSMTRHLR